MNRQKTSHSTLMPNAPFLAAFALFSNLCESGNSISDIIKAFISTSISSKHLTNFSISRLSEVLLEEYCFQLPIEVLRYEISNIPEIVCSKNGQYSVDYRQLSRFELRNDDVIDDEDVIKKELFDFLNKSDSSINSKSKYQKQEIIKQFRYYLLDEDHNCLYENEFSKFIVKADSNIALKNALTRVRDGVILYSGLIYNANEVNSSVWNSPITIFLDTEILFHGAGYNGELYQRMYQDCFSLINKINSSCKRVKKDSIIKLRYFTETKSQIDDFFNAARGIITNQKDYDFSKIAMQHIVSNCNTMTDVAIMQSTFYKDLSNAGIEEYSGVDFYSEDNRKYNLESDEIIEKYSTIAERGGIYVEDRVANDVKMLSHVNIVRHGIKSKDLEGSRYILLSESGRKNRIGKDEEFLPGCSYRLAITIRYLTNKLWYKTSSNFMVREIPDSLSLLSKARFVLSKVTTEAVSKTYEDLKQKVKSGKLDKNRCGDIIGTLQNSIIKPEDVKRVEDLDEALFPISSIEMALHQKEVRESESKKNIKKLSKRDKQLAKSKRSQHNEKLAKYKIKRKNNIKTGYIVAYIGVVLCLLFGIIFAICILGAIQYGKKILLENCNILNALLLGGLVIVVVIIKYFIPVFSTKYITALFSKTHRRVLNFRIARRVIRMRKLEMPMLRDLYEDKESYKELHVSVSDTKFFD